MAVDNPPAGGGIDDAFPTWRKNDFRVCPVASPADGGGGGATKAKQKAAPRRLSSESTAPAPQRGARRASTSRLRRRRAPSPRNTPTPSKRTTPARSQRTCWASPSYLRRRRSLPLTRLRHRPSTKSRSLGDEDCGPSRECFHIDLGGPSEGNHLGIPENGDPPRPAPRVDILRELTVVPVPTGGHDPQLEQIREMQARLDEGAGTLEPFCQDIGQEWAGQPPAGEARHLPQGTQHSIADDARARPPPASSGVGQNLAAAAILLRAMPEPSTTKGWRIQGELKKLLEDAAVRRAESSASRRQVYPSEHRAATSRFMREASVHTGRTCNTAPAAPGRLGNEHHHRNRRAHLDEKVRRGYHPRRGGRYDSGEDRSPSPEPPGPQAFSRAIRRAPFPTRF
jgi:hypothetical protein